MHLRRSRSASSTGVGALAGVRRRCPPRRRSVRLAGVLSASPAFCPPRRRSVRLAGAISSSAAPPTTAPPGAFNPAAAPSTCITRQFSRGPGTVSDCACGACATRHGPAEAPRLSCYACSGPGAAARSVSAPLRPPAMLPWVPRFLAAAAGHAPLGAAFPGAGRPAMSPPRPTHQPPSPSRLPTPSASATVPEPPHPTAAAQLARSCSRSETNAPCSVAATGPSVPVPSATPPTVVNQSA